MKQLPRNRSAQTLILLLFTQSHTVLTRFSETETGVNGNKSVGIPGDTEISAEENEQLQKKKGEHFNQLNLLIKGVSTCSFFLWRYSMFYILWLPPSLQMMSCRGHRRYSLMFRTSSVMLRRFCPALKSGGVPTLTLTTVHTFLSVCQSCWTPSLDISCLCGTPWRYT